MTLNNSLRIPENVATRKMGEVATCHPPRLRTPERQGLPLSARPHESCPNICAL